MPLLIPDCPHLWTPPKPAIIRAANVDDAKRAMLPLMPFFCPLASAAAVTSIAAQASATSNLSTITCPTVIAGDLMVLFDGTAGGWSLVTPSGWTSIGSVNVATTGCEMSYRISNGTESGSTITGGGGTNPRKVVLTFRGDVAISSVSVQNVQTTFGTTSTLTTTSGSGVVPLVVLGGGLGAGASFSQSPTDGGTTSGGTTVQAYMFPKRYNSSPANVAFSWSGSSANNGGQIACYLQCS